jgi:N-dimethylarginine dimethylaminohydrolase
MNSLADVHIPAGTRLRDYTLPAPAIVDRVHRNPQSALAPLRAARPHLIMCAPTHIRVNDSINPWMEGQSGRASRSRARSQWTALREILGRHATIETIEALAGQPDMPFTAIAGLLHKLRFVPSQFPDSGRQAEQAHFTAWFERRGVEICRLPGRIMFEGASDALCDEAIGLLWMGHGQRSELAAAAGLARLLDIDTVPLRLVDPRFPHLDACFCPLPRGVLLWYPAALDEDSRALVESRIHSSLRIAVDEADALAFACNAVSLGSAIVLHRASGKLKRQLDDAGFTTIETPLNEFHKTGGSAKRLTLQTQGSAEGTCQGGT